MRCPPSAWVVVAVVAVVAVVVGASGCAENVNVRVDAPHTQVLLNGTDIGPVDDNGANIDVRPGMSPVVYEIKNGNAPSIVGKIERTEPVWWLVAVGAGGALVCAPALAATGFCIANPAVLGAPLVFLLTGDVGALTATCLAPSWFTLPAVTACGAVGMAPLGLAFMGENVPRKILIRPSSKKVAVVDDGDHAVRY